MTHFLLQSVISIYVPTPNESPFICAAVAQRIYSIMATSGLNYERKWTMGRIEIRWWALRRGQFLEFSNHQLEMNTICKQTADVNKSEFYACWKYSSYSSYYWEI